MAIIKAQNNRRNAANTGWDVIHQETSADLVLMDDGATSLSSRLKFQTAGGTATAITLTGVELVDGFQTTFVVKTSNSAAATTINTKPLYKPGTTTAPKLVAGKAATIWYNSAGDNFFIKASAEGTATAGDVLASKTFSNDDDTGVVGTMPNRGAVTIIPSTALQAIPAGYHDGNGRVNVIPSNFKQMASGSFTVQANPVDFFYNVEYTVSSLGFTPTAIICSQVINGATYMNMWWNGKSLNVSAQYDNAQNNNGTTRITGVGSGYFKITPYDYTNSRTVSWVAFA